MKSLTLLCLIAALAIIALTACQQQPESAASSRTAVNASEKL